MRLKAAFFAVVAIAITTGTTTQNANAQGFVREWTNPLGGEFHFPFNWTGGVPFEEDDALFDLAETLVVELTADAEVRSLLIDRGSVRFEGGNSLTAADAMIRGNLRVAGAGTTVDITGDLNLSTSLGLDRDVIVRDGTTLRGGDTTVGGVGVSGSTVTATVDDGGAWVSENLFVGTMQVFNPGVGSMFVDDGGRINVGDENTIFDGITVGATGFDALLRVGNGSAMGSNTTPMRVGLFAGQTGMVTVTGDDASMDLSTLDVGVAGVAEFSVVNGADLSTDSIDIGGFPGGTAQGTMTIDGTVSLVTANSVSVGAGGDGELFLSDGSLLLVGNGEFTVADGAGSTGLIEITGNAILSTDNLIVGNGGDADVTASNGGKISVQENISVGAGSTLLVFSSTLTVDTLEVNGTMLFRDNAEMVLPLFNTGPITLTGTGKISTNNNSATYQDDIENLGLEIENVGNNASRFEGNYSGIGLFTGTGRIDFSGDVDLGSGTATSKFEGDVELISGANLVVELGGVQAGQFDRIEVAGDLSLVDATLSAAPIGGFAPSAAQQFVIASVGGTLSGQFNGLAEGAVIASGGGIDLTITYSGGDGNDVALITDGYLTGDVNCDGAVNLLDVAPFVDVLSSGVFVSKADIDGDGVVDLLDVAPFVDILTNN